MARSSMVPLLICCCLTAFAAADGVAGTQTRHGLALPGQQAPKPNLSSEDLADIDYMLQDAYADEEYVMELERQELEEIQQMLEEQRIENEQQAQELAVLAAQEAAAAPTTTIKRLAVPLPSNTPSPRSAQATASLASSIGREVRSAVEQAQAMAAELLNNKAALKVLTGGASGDATTTTTTTTQQEEGAPVNVIELASAGSGLDGDIQIDVTVTTMRSGPTWMLPSIFPSNMPSMFGLFGQQDSSSSSDNSKQVELAAQIAQSMIEEALAKQAAGGADADQEIVIDMTIDNAGPQTTQQLVAAATAAAASAVASSALSKHPWESLELQMEVVETAQPFFRSSRFFVMAMLLLTVQLLLCFAVALLWDHTEEEEEEGESEEEGMCYVECDLKQQKQKQQQQQQQQGEWASLAEEGRGLYEKLLSYT